MQHVLMKYLRTGVQNWIIVLILLQVFCPRSQLFVSLHVDVFIDSCENLPHSLEEGGCASAVNLCIRMWAADSTCQLTVLEV